MGSEKNLTSKTESLSHCPSKSNRTPSLEAFTTPSVSPTKKMKMAENIIMYGNIPKNIASFPKTFVPHIIFNQTKNQEAIKDTTSLKSGGPVP